MSKLSTRQKLLTVILSPVIFLGLLEVVLRIAGFSYDPVAEGSRSVPHREWRDIENYRHDPELLWTLKPDTRLDNQGVGFIDVRTNSAGLRGAPLPGKKEPGEIRIVCLGDSILFGLALPEEQSIPALLQRALDASPLGKKHRVRVIPCAVPGWSSLQGVRMLERLKDLEPDLVIFWFGMNDAQPARVLPDVRLGEADERLGRTTSVLRSLRSFQLVQSLVHSMMGGLEEPRRVSPELFGENVRKLQAKAGAGGPGVLFVQVPNLLDLAIMQTEKVIARAEQEGVEKVIGPFRLLQMLNAGPPGCDLRGHLVERDGERVLMFDGPVVDVIGEVKTLKEILTYLQGIQGALRQNLAHLPPDALTPEQVFGTGIRYEFFIDVCHLTPLGSQLAARSLARIIEQRLAGK